MPPDAPIAGAPPTGGPASDLKQLSERMAAIATAQIPKEDFERQTKVVNETAVAVAQLQKMVTDRSLSLPGSDDGKQYSFSRVALALHEGRSAKDWKEIAPYEWDISEGTRTHMRKQFAEQTRGLPQGEQARATLNTLVDSEGGFLVPTEKLAKFYDIFWATLVVTALGVTKLTPKAGEIEIPKATGSVTAYDIFEGKITGLSNSEPTFGLLTLKPHELGVVSTMTQRVLRLADPSIDAFLESQMAKRAAQHMEDRLLNGSGAQGQPNGLLIADGAAAGNFIHLQGTPKQVTDYPLANGATQLISPTVVIDGEGVLEDQNTPLSSTTKILTHPKVLRKFRKDTTNQYTMPTPISREKVKELTGYDWLTSTLLKTTLTKTGATGDGTALAHFIMGNFEDWLVALWGGFELRKTDIAWNPINSTSGFFGRLVHFMGTMLYDAGVIRSESIIASNEVNF